MALPIYKKIPLGHKHIVTDYVALQGNPNFIHNIAAISNGFPAISNDPSFGGVTYNLLPNPNSSVEDQNNPKDAFDGNFNTTWKIFTGFPFGGGGKGQLIFDFGRKIKPRIIRIVYKTSGDLTLDFELFVANKTQDIAQEDLVTGDSITGPVDGSQAIQISGADVDNKKKDLDEDGIFEDTDTDGNDLDFQNSTLTGKNGVEVSDLRECVISSEFFKDGVYDNYQYLVFQFLNPGGNDNTSGIPAFSNEFAQIEIYEELEVKDFSYEFDDALLDLKGWKNPRYEGSKIKQKKLNVYTPSNVVDAIPIGDASVEVSFTVAENSTWEGDTTGPFGFTSMNSSRTTALYYANTVIGGEEDKQFADLKGHSYIQIQKVLVINKDDLSVKIFDRDAVGGDVGTITNTGFQQFNRFITTDFPTGGKLNLQILDDSIESVLKNEYYCKMNKGWLLKSFDFVYQRPEKAAGDPGLTLADVAADPNLLNGLVYENSMYFYSGSIKTKNRYVEQRNVTDEPTFTQFGCTQEEIDNGTCNPGIFIPPAHQTGLRFRYALNHSFPPVDSLFGSETFGDYAIGGLFSTTAFGPSFASSSIIENKFTTQYYSGSFGFILDRSHMTIDDPFNPGSTIFFGNGANANMSEKYRNSGLGSASRFISKDTLNWYFTQGYPETELHLTFLKGTKDFAPGFNDERSIGTFEVSSNQGALELGDVCNGGEFDDVGVAIPGSGLPKNHEIILKGNRDTRFEPTIQTHDDTFISSYLSTLNGIGAPVTVDNAGGCAPDTWNDVQGVEFNDPIGNLDVVEDAKVYIQGGVLGPEGKSGVDGQTRTLPEDNLYSGDLNYQLSFLDKDHVIIIDLDKDREMIEGIGDQGILLIPENLDPFIRKNLERIKQQLSTLLGFGGTSDSAIDLQ